MPMLNLKNLALRHETSQQKEAENPRCRDTHGTSLNPFLTDSLVRQMGFPFHLPTVD